MRPYNMLVQVFHFSYLHVFVSKLHQVYGDLYLDSVTQYLRPRVAISGERCTLFVVVLSFFFPHPFLHRNPEPAERCHGKSPNSSSPGGRVVTALRIISHVFGFPFKNLSILLQECVHTLYYHH